MGLIRRHMKTQHGIQISAAPPNVDGAKSQEKQLIKCDRCNYRATTHDDLVKHLDTNHVTKQSRCNICQMVADSNTHLEAHMKQQHSRENTRQKSQAYNQNNQPQNNNTGFVNRREKPVCKFWLQGNCSRGPQCRFAHHETQRNTAICRDGDYCLFWPQCKYAHVEMCRYQENCFRQNCRFMHGNPNFLEVGNNISAPNIQSHQDFPPFPEQMWGQC